MKSTTSFSILIILFIGTFILQTTTNLYSQLIPSIPVSLIDDKLGLLNRINFTTFKDSRNLVWISSRNGLYRYDGKNLRMYLPSENNSGGLRPNQIHSSICEDNRSNIWFGIWEGISCYNRLEDKFINYKIPNANPNARFFACGFDINNELWFTHDNGIYTLNVKTGFTKHKSKFLRDLWNSELQYDKSGHIEYIYSYKRYKSLPGLYIHRFSNSEFCYSTSVLTSNHFDSIAINDVDVISDTCLLIASTQGLYRYNIKTNEFHIYRPKFSDPNWTVNAITRWNDSLELIGTSDQDFYTFNVYKNTFHEHFKISSKGENLSDPPLAMYTDSNGGVWIHLQLRGIAYCHPRNLVFKHFPITINHKEKSKLLKVQGMVEFNKNTVLLSSETNGGYFIGSKEGNIQGDIHRCKNCLPFIHRCFKDSKGRIWMTNDGQLFVMNANAVKLNIDHHPSILFGHYFCELKDGRIMLSAQDGKILLASDKGINTISITELTSIDSSYMYRSAALHSNGLLYVFATNKHKNLSELIVFNSEKNFRVIRKIPFSNNVQALRGIEGSDDFIVGTNAGAFYFDANKEHFSLIDYSDYKCDNTIWGIIPIGNFNYLLSGENGIFVIDVRKKESQYFSLEHGLGMMSFTWFGYLQHSSGKIWLANSSGITTCDPHHLAVPELVLPVHIMGIRINDQIHDSLLWKDKNISNPNEIKSLHLPYSSNTLSFDFAALSYAGIDVLEYEYRVTHYDRDWVSGGKQGFARYVNIPPGKYDFEVRVRNKPSTTHSVFIQISPPFYLEPWFIILSCSALFFIVYQLVRIQQRRKQRLLQLKYEKQLAIEHERLRISNNLHDDLGSGLSALNLKAQVMEQYAHDPGLKTEFHQLSSGIGILARQVRETIWTINSANDTVDNLLTHLHQYTLEYFDGTGINCKLKLPEEQLKNPISATHRRELYLCYKEALHNILKHACATDVMIEMKVDENNSLMIRIYDNGKGFELDKNYSGLGMLSMKKRMQDIGGTFSISTSPQGTLIVLTYTI